MYRQVLVEPAQRPLQCILWRSAPNEDVETYTLNTLTYGTASAAYLATRVLLQLADECQEDYPQAAVVIRRCFYVDDLLVGFATEEEAKGVCHDVRSVLADGHYHLRKWLSNRSEVLEGLSCDANRSHVLDLDPEKRAKPLGLQWLCTQDLLTYSVKPGQKTEAITKRTILSRTAQIFDPLWLVGPCIVKAKLVIQELWALKLSWDESIPVSLHTGWNRFVNELPLLNDLAIPRLLVWENPSAIQVHGFADASKRAYGACVDCRSVNNEGQVLVRLMAAKTKVAPLKTQSIPRLELCAALLLARLIRKVEDESDMHLGTTTLWTDSAVVLGWLRKEPHTMDVFVGNRVVAVQELVPHAEWRYVPTKENPADLISSGCFPREILFAELWWNGPGWLTGNPEDWPVLANQEGDCKNELTVAAAVVKIKTEVDWIGIERFSRFYRLNRVAAYCLRFLSKIRKSSTGRTGEPLSCKELKDAVKELVRIAQREAFAHELDALRLPNGIVSKGPMLGLSPFLDEDGIIRVGGRLKLSSCSFGVKHPMILPHKHHLTYLIATSEHLRLLHAGPALLLGSLRTQFWVISGRNLARRVVRQCMRCQRETCQPTAPVMGEFHAKRTQGGRPFLCVGTDYAGPIMTRDRKGRGFKKIKSYICLFICFASRAVHLEAVSDLTSQSFLMAFRRFVARRGLPAHIYSDNGLNYVGAHSELKELGSFLMQNEQDIAIDGVRNGVQWHFIPAYAPHFGGLWEAGIKSVKAHLRRIAGDASLTFEELATLLIQIEGVLNSRPLAPLSTDPTDLEALTPAHFLIGQALMDLPDLDLAHLPDNRLSNFQRIQAMKQNFWRRWYKEYLTEMQKRAKWKTIRDQLRVGDLVMVKEDALPPLQLAMGRVVEVHPGKDGVTRVATVRTANGTIKRSWSKLCRLPLPHDS